MSCLRNGIVTYLSLVWLDIAVLAATALAMLGIYFVPNSTGEYRVVPMWHVDTSCLASSPHGSWRGPKQFSFPYSEPIISSWACALIVIGIPILVIALGQVKLRSWWDFHTAVCGLLKAVVTASFCQVILKQSIGGFRPHYLSVCKPDVDGYLQGHDGSFMNGYLFVPPSACTGNEDLVRTALQSFPSGHAASSFAAALFLALYLNAKQKAFADISWDYTVFIGTVSPLLGASVIVGTLLLDHHHHPHDIIFGIIIGLVAGALAYRTSYCSLIDFRYNHIPLPPSPARIRFSYKRPQNPRTTVNLIDTSAESADDLVFPCYWGAMGQDSDIDRARWLRSIKSLRRSTVELGGYRGSIYPASVGRTSEPQLGGHEAPAAMADLSTYREGLHSPSSTGVEMDRPGV